MDLRRSTLYRRYLEPHGVRLASTTIIEYPDAILELVGAGLGISLLPRASVTGPRAATTVVTRPVSARRGGYRIAWSAAFHRDRRSPWVDEAIRLIRMTRGSVDTPISLASFRIASCRFASYPPPRSTGEPSAK
jgi:DNA-binding transcriptional LysR family regulator